MLCTFRGRRPWRQSIRLIAAMATGTLPAFPDFEQEVQERATLAAPLVADLQRFGDLVLQRGETLLVDLCTVDEHGRFALGLHVSELRASVRPSDQFLGGVVFSGSAEFGTCQVSPRILRILCRNGAVLPTDREIETESYLRTSAEEASGDLEEVIGVALSLRTVASAAGALRGAALSPVLDPLRELDRLGVGLLAHDAHRVLAVFRRGRDRSLYGAFNALTEVARETSDLGERERLERLAGGLIPALRRRHARTDRPVLV